MLKRIVRSHYTFLCLVLLPFPALTWSAFALQQLRPRMQYPGLFRARAVVTPWPRHFHSF